MATPAEPAPQSRTDVTSARSLGQLVSDVSTDLSQIVRGELELAKTEIKQDVSHAGKGAGMFAGAAVLGLYGLGLLFLGLATPMVSTRKDLVVAGITVAATVAAVVLLPEAWQITSAAVVAATVGVFLGE